MKNTEELLNRIVEQEEQIQALQKRIKEEQDINKKKDTLISQISHEIRTPLNVVISMADIAKEELNNTDVVSDNLTEIANSSRILLGIVNNILDISALANGKMKLQKNKFDLKDEITNLGIYFYEHARYKNVHFDMHIQGVEEENLIGDERRLQQIMVNLFSNSLRFTQDGGKIDLTVVQASTSRNRVHMRFIMQDTGSGLSEEMIHDLFLPYDEKAAVVENDYTDTGISLFVTKQLIEMLGGTISVESNRGNGTKFIVDLPFQKTVQREMDITAVRKHRVLVVADEVVAQERGKMLLDMGVSFEAVSDGYTALDMLGQAEDEGKPFSVCMIDMNMKDAYADALVSEIKKIFGNEPVIIATSYNRAEEKYKHLGADYIIDNTLFRSTIFDALMKIEKGNLVMESHDKSYDSLKLYNFSRKRIMVVEDIALNMEVVVKLLSKVNASVVCAENGKEALQTFLRKPAGYFDCILMDINMPVLDGYEATKAIRSSGKEDAETVPIFAMTANAFAEDITQALEAGMNGHIAKPIDVQVLYKTLNKLFNGFENPEIEEDLLKKAQLLERQNTELKERAEHDPLTGLFNRYAYEKETYSLLRKKEPVCFILLDIDHFKEINDLYGHEKGDEVLKYVANVLKANVRPSDFVVRLGGDEFAIILREFGPDRQKMYDKFAKISRELLNTNNEIPGITLSAGVAFSDIGYTTELYGNADKALYQTKKNGRNGCTVFEEDNWKEQDEIEKLEYELKDYMDFSLDGRQSMGDTISILGYRLLEYSIKTQLVLRYGREQQKEVFRDAGFSAGMFFVSRLLDRTQPLDRFADQLVEKLQELKIGNLVLEEMDEKTGEAILSVFEDADCSGMNSLGEAVCNYAEGFIAGVLTAYTNKKYSAIETECWAKGDKACKFVATPQHKNEV